MAEVKSATFDLVIVGGGAVGAALALALDKIGYRVAVIERSTPSFSSAEPERVIALNYGSRAFLERLGLWPAVAAEGVGEINHIVVTEPGNRGLVELNAAESARPIEALGYVAEMGLLLKPIYAKLAQSDVTLLAPATLQSYRTDDEKVAIDVEVDGAPLQLEARLLVAADGTQSQLRRMAGIGLHGWDYNRFGIVASVASGNGHQNTAHECFKSSGPLAFLPLTDGRYSIVWATRPAEAVQLLAMEDDAFIATLERAAGPETIARIGRITTVSKRASYPLELSIAASFTDARLALVGNAAHTIHPVAGQGMNLGFRDIEDLVAQLDSDLAKSDPGKQIILQGYAEKRRADVAAVAGFTESMSHIFGSEVPGAKLLRGLALEKLPFAASLKSLLLTQASGIGQMQRLSQQNRKLM